MIESGGGLRLLLESPHPILIAGEFGRKNLERHFPAQTGIFSQIHFTHAARSDLRADLVTA
jgi:hypothetical protein